MPSRKGKPTDCCPAGVELYFLPVETRVPVKFGPETMTCVTCARVCVRMADSRGRQAQGWGETPLSVQWVWPGNLPYQYRHEALEQLCILLARAWAEFDCQGHPIEIGHEFQRQVLPDLLRQVNASRNSNEQMPWLAALVCCSTFDIALHDAYGHLHQLPVYETYGPEFMSRDLADFLEPAEDSGLVFAGRYPRDYLTSSPPSQLPAWHLVAGLDPLRSSDLTGSEPDDSYPVLLSDWIQRDGLKYLKIKLRGNDDAWDYQRIVDVGHIAIEHKVDWLTSDFNCTVTEPQYVNAILDRLLAEQPDIHRMLLYVEQPFPYDLEASRIDVHSVSGRKPLFMIDTN